MAGLPERFEGLRLAWVRFFALHPLYGVVRHDAGDDDYGFHRPQSVDRLLRLDLDLTCSVVPQ